MTAVLALEYEALRSKVSALLEAGLARAREAVDQEKARTYWEVGRLLNEQLGGRAGYGDQVVTRLAADIGVNRAVLYRMMRFHRRLPNIAAWQKLTWSHCRALITVPDDRALRRLLDRSLAEHWTVRQLEDHIRREAPPRAPRLESGHAAAVAVRPVPAALQPRRGVLRTYRLVSSSGPGGEEQLALDLGFRVRRPLSALGLGGKQSRKLAASGLGPDDTVELAEGRGGPKLHPTAVGRERLFTYAAALRRVVDGDTLELEVDLGEGVRIVQRVRLRGIDAAELGSEGGQRARAFVEQRLAGAGPVVVKTFRPDKYDRYLADVFYLPGGGEAAAVAAEGTFLNAELLREGMASVYR